METQYAFIVIYFRNFATINRSIIHNQYIYKLNNDFSLPTEILLWIGFCLFLLAMLALDLGVFHKESHVVTFKEAIIWSTVWISLALIFNAGVFYFAGNDKGMEFLTGYLIEKSLSIDNVFVIALIFTYFKVPEIYQHRVLFWGVLGALIMRAVLIALGSALVKEFTWIIISSDCF